MPKQRTLSAIYSATYLHRKAERPIQVVMLGDSLSHNGGIVTVEKLILKYIPPTVTIYHIGTHESGSIARRLRLYGSGLVKFINRLLTHRVDLVHIHLADWGSVPRKVLIAIVALLFRKPIIMHTHGAEFHLTYKALPDLGRRFLSRLFQRCDRLIVLSKSWQNFYVNELELAEARVATLPNPIELPGQIPERSHSKILTLLFMGKIGQRKGAFDLIRAFAQLPIAPQSRLLLAGDGEIEQARALVAQLNLGDRVQILGWIEAEQRSHLLVESDIFVLPSYNEALPMALLEAMAWGLPVVSCPVGGIADFVCSGQNGLLVSSGNLEQLTAALRSLMVDASLRAKLGQKARQSVESLDVQQYVLRLEQIYRSCVCE